MLKDITKGCGVVGILVGSYSMLEGLLPGLLLSIEEGGGLAACLRFTFGV